MSEGGTVGLDIAGPVARLTISNPTKANALTWSMLEQLSAAIDRLSQRTFAADDPLRVVVLRGAGERFFCAGAFIDDWAGLPPAEMASRWIRFGSAVFERLARLDAVVIAALNGDALGGGLELALAADLRFAADGATIGLPETAIGAVPGWNGVARLAALAGVSTAKRMVLLGDRLSASEAERLGLVHGVAARDGLEDLVAAATERALARSPDATRVAKLMLNAEAGIGRTEALHELAAAYAKSTPDAAEGVAAFREKRPPGYSGGSKT